MQTKKFWNWLTPVRNENESDAERVLELYGTIAEQSWFDDEVTPQMFKDELFSGTGPVTIWLSSPGGDCVAASQIYAMLMDYKGDVTVKIDGIAASAASVIAMAGTRVLMAPMAMMMVHNPATMAFGDHNDMKKAIELLDEVKESMKKSVADHLSQVVGKDTKVESRSTGELQAALGVSPVKVDRNGNHDIKIGVRPDRAMLEAVRYCQVR